MRAPSSPQVQCTIDGGQNDAAQNPHPAHGHQICATHEAGDHIAAKPAPHCRAPLVFDAETGDRSMTFRRDARGGRKVLGFWAFGQSSPCATLRPTSPDSDSNAAIVTPAKPPRRLPETPVYDKLHGRSGIGPLIRVYWGVETAMAAVPVESEPSFNLRDATHLALAGWDRGRGDALGRPEASPA